MAPLIKGGNPRLGTKRIVLALAVMTALSVVLAGAPVVLGEGDELSIVSQEVVSNFPDGITFRVTAAGPDPVNEIRVFLRPLGSDRSTYGYLEIEPANQVSGEYVMSTSTGATHKPPGTVIEYSYEIRDTAGRVLRTDDQEFLYLDGRLDWKSITNDSGLLTVYYYGEFVEKRGPDRDGDGRGHDGGHGQGAGYSAHGAHPHRIVQQLP